MPSLAEQLANPRSTGAETRINRGSVGLQVLCMALLKDAPVPKGIVDSEWEKALNNLEIGFREGTPRQLTVFFGHCSGNFHDVLVAAATNILAPTLKTLFGAEQKHGKIYYDNLSARNVLGRPEIQAAFAEYVGDQGRHRH